SKPNAHLFLLVDENTQEHCLPIIESGLTNRTYSVFKIKAGEIHKNIETCIDVWRAMTTANLDRQAIMLNIGGGTICDLGGFCAATFKRGISFVQIPTTLLSQVDASIGGKLGIDFEGYKNHIGVFKSPETVLIDPVFLNTLSDRELRSGYAEVIKHCLIADGDHWKELIGIHDLKNANWNKIIRRSMEVKRKIVIDDPYEKNKRKLLNFGHTIGHAIESHFLHSPHPLLHGEAIAAGMIYETMLSAKQLRLRIHEQNEIIHYIISLYGKPPPLNMKVWLPLMKQDKKNINGKISFSLLRDIGVSEWDVLLGEQELNELK
ncbi:MAG: 3-dehydroquinate synthase, partial [Saprospiraceae bacterium]